MRYDFVVTLKRENARRADFASFLLLVFSLLAFVFAQIRSLQFSYFLSVAAITVAAGLFINLAASRKKEKLHFRNWLLAAGVFWLGMPFFQWMILPFVFFALLESQAKYPLEVGFSSDQIVINSFIKKKIAWHELDGVMIKDGLLTLDFKNNQLLQREVLDEDDPDADENEFNEYCREKIVNLHA